MRAAYLFQRSLNSYRKSINAPYRKKDLISIVGTIIILAAIPLTVISARQAWNWLTRAAGPAAIEAENATLSGPVTAGSDTNASGGKYIEFDSAGTSPGFQPTAPYYATFFYPWSENPNTDGRWSYWNDAGHNSPSNWFSHYLPDPNPSAFDPANELYSSNNYNIVKWQLAKLAEAKQEVGISSWWGQNHKTDVAFRNIVTDFMKRADNPYPNFRWTIYYEKEGFGNPPVSELVSDINYIKNNYATQPGFFKIGGKPVIFVYAAAHAGSSPSEDLSRWQQARDQTGVYVVMKKDSLNSSTASSMDSWHEYAPASRTGTNSPYYYFVSPGFWLEGNAVRLARDLNAFRSGVQAMVAANVTWKLTQTWNEWGEGTSVEPGDEANWTTTGTATLKAGGVPFKNQYIDALNQLLPALEGGTGL